MITKTLDEGEFLIEVTMKIDLMKKNVHNFLHENNTQIENKYNKKDLSLLHKDLKSKATLISNR